MRTKLDNVWEKLCEWEELTNGSFVISSANSRQPPWLRRGVHRRPESELGDLKPRRQPSKTKPRAIPVRAHPKWMGFCVLDGDAGVLRSDLNSHHTSAL